MSLIGKYVHGGEKVWIHYNIIIGQAEYGDYSYVKMYAKKCSEKDEDGETYIKAIIDDVSWHYKKVQFELTILNKDGSKSDYHICITEPERLTVIKEDGG